MASTPLGDPEALDALATVLDRVGDQVWGAGDRVRHDADCSTWKAARADRFRAAMAQRQREAHNITEELHALAARLRASARAVRDELGGLGRIEDQIRQLIDNFIPGAGSAAPWIGTTWSPTNLPPTGDPAWRKVQADLQVDRQGGPR